MRWISLLSLGHSLNAKEYTFFSSACGTFSRIDYILGHKSNLSKFKKIEITLSIFSNHNAMRLDINYKKTFCKKHKHMEIKQHISKNPTGYWRNQKGKQKISRNKWQWKHDNSKKPMGYSKNSPKREVYSNTILLQETRKTSNRQPNLTPKTTGKRRIKKTQN